MDERQMATIQTPNGVTLRVSAKTGLNGLSERTRAIIAGMAQAAPAAGISVIDITAGKEGGHLSHANGTEVDLKAYSADGSLWTTAQRVALAAGAQAGGADRFGLYSFGKGKLGSGTMHVGFSGPGRPPAVWGADSKVRGDASRRFTDPAEKAFLASYQAGQPFDIASLGLTPLDPSQPAPLDAQGAIASLVNPAGGTQVPDAPSAAMGFAPTITDVGFAAPDSVRYEGNPFGVGAQPVQTAAAPPMPQPPPQWASAQGFPIDESLTGQTAQDVLAGGPRMDPRRPPPGSGPVPADMGAMRSPLDVLNAGPNLDPRRAVASGPVGPTTPQGVLDMGPNLRPPNVPMPPPRPERGAGIPDPRMRPDPASLPPRGFPTAFGEQPQPLMGGMSAAMGNAPSRTGDLSAAMGGPPSRSGDLSAAMGGPPDPLADFGTRDLGALASGQRTIADANYYRPQNIMAPPSPPAPATMGERFDMASAQPNAAQMFGLPDMNGASFPAPPSPIGTAGAGSTTGEFFTPAPPMPSPGPDPMAGRFNDAFSPAGPGMIADLQGAFDRRQSPAPPAPPTMTAQDGINQIFGAPPAAAMPPNLAIPFNEVPGFMGVSPAAAATPALPPMGMGTFNDRFAPAMPAPPQPISVQSFNDRFAGGTVAPGGPPPPGTPGVVQGTMPGAMDIRPPAQGGPPLPPQALPQANPTPAPRQTNVGAERQRSGTIGRILGGLLGGPVGALGGGLLGGGGGGIFGGGSVTPMGASFSSPYMQPNGQMGSTNVQRIQSGNMQGTAWNRNGGGSVGYVTDPFTGSMIYTSSPTTY